MREVSIDTQTYTKICNGKNSFYEKELSKNFPSLTPGEWFYLNYNDESFTAFGNDNVKNGPKVWILVKGKKKYNEYLKDAIKRAINKREYLYGDEGKRLIFGQNDNLPGMIVDSYKEHIIIQINTAGLDQHREFIRQEIGLYFNKKIVLLDNQAYRENESLPIYPAENLEEEVISIIDSAITYKMTFSKLQKLGFYFDHRDNRKKFETYLNVLPEACKLKCLDLFCYLGAWGLHSMRSGVKEVCFVDQANLETEVDQNVVNSGFAKKYEFVRQDVFKFLDDKISIKEKWNVVICDPPSFCKSLNQKNQALSVYKKLYNRIFKILETDGTLVAASCTKYISLEELTNIVSQQAKENNRKVWLRDIGQQSMDHPISNINDSANYIKYALYNVE